MSAVQIERVGDSVVVEINGYTLMLERGDALTLGSRLMQVAALGGDNLDDAMCEQCGMPESRCETVPERSNGSAPACCDGCDHHAL